jgi:hypothetical protein
VVVTRKRDDCSSAVVRNKCNSVNQAFEARMRSSAEQHDHAHGVQPQYNMPATRPFTRTRLASGRPIACLGQPTRAPPHD